MTKQPSILVSLVTIHTCINLVDTSQSIELVNAT